LISIKIAIQRNENGLIVSLPEKISDDLGYANVIKIFFIRLCRRSNLPAIRFMLVARFEERFALGTTAKKKRLLWQKIKYFFHHNFFIPPLRTSMDDRNENIN